MTASACGSWGRGSAGSCGALTPGKPTSCRQVWSEPRTPRLDTCDARSSSAGLRRSHAEECESVGAVLRDEVQLRSVVGERLHDPVRIGAAHRPKQEYRCTLL